MVPHTGGLAQLVVAHSVALYLRTAIVEQPSYTMHAQHSSAMGKAPARRVPSIRACNVGPETPLSFCAPRSPCESARHLPAGQTWCAGCKAQGIGLWHQEGQHPSAMRVWCHGPQATGGVGLHHPKDGSLDGQHFPYVHPRAGRRCRSSANWLFVCHFLTWQPQWLVENYT